MPADVDKLPGTLHDIAQETLEIISNNENITKEKIPYLKRDFQVIELTSGRKHIINVETDEIEKEEWSSNTIQEIIDELKTGEEYDKALDYIGDRGENMRRPPDLLLREFVSSIMEFESDNVLGSDITNQVSLFISHIDDSAISWKTTLWIDGLDMDADSIDIDDSTRLRTPNENDLVEESKISEDTPHTPSSVPTAGPSAILEVTRRAKDENEIFTELQKLIYGLRLYSVSSVSRIRLHLDSSGVVSFPPTTVKSTPNTPFRYTLSSDNESNLQEFMTKMTPVVEEKIIEKEEDDYLNIAFDRYKSALNDNDSDESRLTSAIMALEALLLKDEERAELSERLSRRTDILLSFFSYQEIEVSRKVRRAYEIRSRYVHGSKIGEEDISELTERIMDYARKCIVLFLQVPEDEGKDNLLSAIDRSSLQDESKKSLEEDLSNWCEI